MRATIGYLAAHPSWFDEDPDLTCPRCGTEPETFRHAVLTCPARARDRDLLLQDVSSLEREAMLWSEPDPIRALGDYITDTKTRFPPDMIPQRYFAPSLSPPPTQD